MQVRCQKCRFKFNATVPDDGSTIEVVCPRCGERQAVHGEVAPQPVQSVVAQPVRATQPAVAQSDQQTQPAVAQPVQPAQPITPEATVPQPPANQPQPEQPVQQQGPQPVIIYQESKSNTLPIFIIAGVALALIVLGGLWMINRNSKVEYAPNANEATVEAVDTTEALAAVEEVVTDSAAFDDFETEDDTPTNEEFTPRYTSAGYEGFGQLPFVIERQLQQSGLNIAQFAEVKRLGTIRGQMILYEHSDGVRYQLFFDESASSSSALLTGIAISRKSDDPSGDCYHMDYLLDNADYDDRGNIYYNSSTGMYFSPGYKNGRVYCYIYTSYAPSKDPAPRG